MTMTAALIAASVLGIYIALNILTGGMATVITLGCVATGLAGCYGFFSTYNKLSEPLQRSKYASVVGGTPFQIPVLSFEETVSYPEKFVASSAPLIPSDSSLGSQVFAVSVNEAHWPGIMQKCIVIMDPDVSPKHGDYVLLIREGMLLPAIKQVIWDENRIFLRAMDPLLPLTERDDAHKILGVVVQIRRSHDHTALMIF